MGKKGVSADIFLKTLALAAAGILSYKIIKKIMKETDRKKK